MSRVAASESANRKSGSKARESNSRIAFSDRLQAVELPLHLLHALRGDVRHGEVHAHHADEEKDDRQHDAKHELHDARCCSLRT